MSDTSTISHKAPRHTAGSAATPASAVPRKVLIKRIAITAVVPLFFLSACILCFVSALHSPAPHHLALTIAGPEQVTSQLATDLDKHVSNGFDVAQTTNPAQAHDDVADRTSIGGLAVEGNQVTVYKASAAGQADASVVENVGDRVAARLGTAATVRDVAPLPADDPLGIALFYFLAACTIASFLPITIILQALCLGRVCTRS